MPSLCAAGAVAEMTGRRGRVVADAKGRGVYELRAKPESTEMDSLNVSETGIRVFCGAEKSPVLAVGRVLVMVKVLHACTPLCMPVPVVAANVLVCHYCVYVV